MSCFVDEDGEIRWETFSPSSVCTLYLGGRGLGNTTTIVGVTQQRSEVTSSIILKLSQANCCVVLCEISKHLSACAL